MTLPNNAERRQAEILGEVVPLRPLTRESVLAACEPLIQIAGAALHILRPKAKAPAERGWSKARVHTIESFKKSYPDGANVGIRLGKPSESELGFIHLIDLDIRHADKAPEAHAALREMWPDYVEFPRVISGSGGESRHIYFWAPTPFCSRKLARSKGFDMVPDPNNPEKQIKRRHWEIELFGTGKQAVIPPSIHPDTGLPYCWERPIGFNRIELFDLLGEGPIVSADLVASWGAELQAAEDDDDMASLVRAHRAKPLDLTEEMIDQTIADLPEWWVEDRDKWLEVGMALDHQYEGSDEGYSKWCDWSEQSDKFDIKDSGRVWQSFGAAKNPIRFASLIQAANRYRLERAHSDLEVDGDGLDQSETSAVIEEDFSDSLGSPAVKVDSTDAVAVLPWKSLMPLTKDGEVRANLHNLALIVTNDKRIKGCIAFNELRQRKVIVAEPRRLLRRGGEGLPIGQLESPIWRVSDPLEGTPWDDSHENALRRIIEAPVDQGGHNVKVSKADLGAAIDCLAHENHYHPLRDLLIRLGEQHDGIARVDHLFVDFLGCPDDIYHRQTARMMMVAAVARIFEPGHKFDQVTILEGDQGIKKSTFIKALAFRKWKTDLGGADFTDPKKLVEKILGYWIVEIPELQGFDRADLTSLKAQLSLDEDNVRLSYERNPRVYKRQCIFIGSTNDRDYLRDPTGARRFWPIQCRVGAIDIARLEDQLPQLWGEAVQMYQQMRAAQPKGDLPLFLSDPQAEATHDRLCDLRRIASEDETLAGQIEHWLNQPIGAATGFDDLDPDAPPRYRDETCVKEVRIEFLGHDKAMLDQRLDVIVGKAMNQVEGWEQGARIVTKKYGRQVIYKRVRPLALPSPD